MDFTAPQRFLLEARQPDLEDYMLAIDRRPGSLEYVIDRATQAGLSTNDLKALIGFAQKRGIIDFSTYKYYTGKLDLRKGRTQRLTGRIDPRDSSNIDDDDDDRSVLCVARGCGKRVSPTRAKLSSGGWVCDKCYGVDSDVPKPTSGAKTIDL